MAQRQSIAYQRLLQAADRVGARHGVRRQVEILKAANAKDPAYQQMLQSEALADLFEALAGATQEGEQTVTLRAAIANATDDELTAIPGIGEKSIEALREWANEQPEATEDAHDEQAEQVAAESAPVPPVTVEDVEKELEAETGHDVVKTSDDPPTFVETDKPAPDKNAGSRKK